MMHISNKLRDYLSTTVICGNSWPFRIIYLVVYEKEIPLSCIIDLMLNMGSTASNTRVYTRNKAILIVPVINKIVLYLVVLSKK